MRRSSYSKVGSFASDHAEKKRRQSWREKYKGRVSLRDSEPKRFRNHITGPETDSAVPRRHTRVCPLCTNMPWLRPCEGCPLGPLGCGLPYAPEASSGPYMPLLSSMSSEPR